MQPPGGTQATASEGQACAEELDPPALELSALSRHSKALPPTATPPRARVARPEITGRHPTGTVVGAGALPTPQGGAGAHVPYGGESLHRLRPRVWPSRTRQPLTTGRSQRQENDHGVDHQNVHGGCLPAGPAKEDLVLGLGLQEKGEGGWAAPRRRRTGKEPDRGAAAGLTQLYTSSPSLLLRMRCT